MPNVGGAPFGVTHLELRRLRGLADISLIRALSFLQRRNCVPRGSHSQEDFDRKVCLKPFQVGLLPLLILALDAQRRVWLELDEVDHWICWGPMKEVFVLRPRDRPEFFK